jgi:hypothetical protein
MSPIHVDKSAPPDHASWTAAAERGWQAIRDVMAKRRKRVAVVVLILGTIVPTVGTAQAPADSLIGTVLSRATLGPWYPGKRGTFCLWTAERPDRPHLLTIVDAVPADTTVRPLCPDPLGGYAPVLVEADVCPEAGDVFVTDRAFILVRCAPDGAVARYRRRPLIDRRAQ